MARPRRAIWLAAITACVCAAALASAAQAKWGPKNNCYRDETETHHCYSIEEFNMSGYPREYGDGAAILDYTQEMNVPGWASGDFVTNELWVSFPGNENYIETGQIGGAFWDCCTLHPFFASTMNNHQYIYESPGTEPKAAYNPYEIWDPCHCGTWGIWWGGRGNGAGTLVKTDNGYPAWDTELQGGMEAGANSQPYNWGKDQVATVEPPPDSWYEWKSGFGNHSHPVVSPGQCLARNQDAPYWGNINWATCQATSASLDPETPAVTGTPLAPGQPLVHYATPSGPEIGSAAAERVAVEYAARAGDPAPTGMSMAHDTFGTEQAVLEPAGRIAASAETSPWLARSTYLVVMHGRFTMTAAPVPPGHHAVEGPVLAVLVDAHTGHIDGRYVGPTSPSSAALLPLPGPVAATAASVAAIHREARSEAPARIAGTLLDTVTRPGHAFSRPASGWRVVVERSGEGRSPRVHPVTVASARTDRRGRFTVTVAPGRYLVAGVRPGGPVCGGAVVVVRTGPATTLRLGCSK